MNGAFAPATAVEAAEWVASRHGAYAAFEVRGSGTRARPAQRDVLVTSALREIRFFYPEDMVVGVEAGLPFEMLARLLAERGMILPCNPWYRGATIGGMAAANDFGPNRLYGGGLRDAIIGIEYINGRGALVKAGGRVVKNVSGYDLCRMMLGSLGGLGVITALNFKVLPAPVAPHGLFWRGEGIDWRDYLAEGALQRKLPLDWLQVFARKGEWRLGLGISGNAPRRERLWRDWRTVFEGRLEMSADGAEPEAFAHLSAAGRFAGFLSPPCKTIAANHVHLHGLAPTRAFFTDGQLLPYLLQILTRTATRLVLHPLGGDFHLFLEDPGEAARIVSELAEILAARAGFLVIEKAPVDFYQSHFVIPLPPSYGLMCKLKRNLDPRAIFFAPFYEMENHEPTLKNPAPV